MHNKKLHNFLANRGDAFVDFIKNTTISYQNIDSWRNGKTPSLEKIMSAAKYLNVNIEEALSILEIKIKF